MISPPRPFLTTGRLFVVRGLMASEHIDWEANAPGTIRSTKHSGAPGWTHITLTSKISLAKEEDQPSQGLFQYDYWARSAKNGRHILVAGHADLVPHLLKTAMLHDRVSVQEIDIPGLVRDLTLHPGAYVMSAVFARVEGYGLSFRTVLLYGSDLAEAKLFHEFLNVLVPYRVTLRDATTEADVLSAGIRGEVGFPYSDTSSLARADEALRFLADRKFVPWEVSE